MLFYSQFILNFQIPDTIHVEVCVCVGELHVKQSRDQIDQGPRLARPLAHVL